MMFGNCLCSLKRGRQQLHARLTPSKVQADVRVEDGLNDGPKNSLKTEKIIIGSKDSREHSNSPVEQIAAQFEITEDELQIAVDGFIKQLNEGLGRNGSPIEQLPSYIQALPSGKEQGTNLALDLGGTNIRICLVTFNGDRTYSMEQDKKAIPPDLMISSSPQKLFSWVAKSVYDFVRDPSQCDKGKNILSLGFTFSHAVNQHNIMSGTLLRWSKGFDIDDAVGKDVCILLQEAFTELGMHVKVNALINDTVGTLLASAYGPKSTGPTILGAVFGTGTNGAYVEQIHCISKLANQARSESSTMIMNTEWGNFDPDLEFLPDTKYDQELDRMSVNSRVELFEKRISGMYLGELLRLAVLDLHEQSKTSLFSHIRPPLQSGLFVPNSIDSSFLTELECDTTSDMTRSRTSIGKWLGAEVNYELARSICLLARAVGTRSARLSAVALGAVILQTKCLNGGADEVVIGVDGSLVELYPCFVPEMRCVLRCMNGIGPAGESRLKIVVIKDGSAVGAALAAYLAAGSH